MTGTFRGACGFAEPGSASTSAPGADTRVRAPAYRQGRVRGRAHSRAQWLPKSERLASSLTNSAAAVARRMLRRGNPDFSIARLCRRGEPGARDMDRRGTAAIVVVKRKKVVAGGHHGGAWKVAYADFVTAMMAFFLLMWLLSDHRRADAARARRLFQPDDPDPFHPRRRRRAVRGLEHVQPGRARPRRDRARRAIPSGSRCRARPTGACRRSSASCSAAAATRWRPTR